MIVFLGETLTVKEFIGVLAMYIPMCPAILSCLYITLRLLVGWCFRIDEDYDPIDALSVLLSCCIASCAGVFVGIFIMATPVTYIVWTLGVISVLFAIRCVTGLTKEEVSNEKY
jgi:ribose/xylose/arabinose/galactoside ABC-type transport system permease subunit